jgi:hypothetical protein
MKRAILSTLILPALLTATAVRADTVDNLLASYAADGAGPFSAAAGEDLWQSQQASADGSRRACTSCHTNDLRHPGRHATTGRSIEPLAPSVNARRLTDAREIEKWFTRNCKWTLGRACTPQEKGDLLSFLREQ